MRIGKFNGYFKNKTVKPSSSLHHAYSLSLRFFLFGLPTGGMSLRLLPSMKQPSVTMKTKAKKTSSDSEIINFAYFVFCRSEFLHLQYPLTCGTQKLSVRVIYTR